jgi:TetR/AcrR family transcriptional repressor of lmrAB and yxaGH operons
MSRREDVIPALAEVFRTQGYEGASLSLLGAAAGLGKGSLYNFFPGGKEEMAQAVVTQIDGWFRDEMFMPLREAEDPRAGIRDMLRATDRYFHSGRRVCLIGAFALADSRDRFARQLELYFAEWIDALAAVLRRMGMSTATARGEAEDAVAAIQGALVLARAADDLGVFARVLRRLERRLLP